MLSTFIYNQQLSLRSHTDLFNRNYNEEKLKKNLTLKLIFFSNFPSSMYFNHCYQVMDVTLACAGQALINRR